MVDETDRAINVGFDAGNGSIIQVQVDEDKCKGESVQMCEDGEDGASGEAEVGTAEEKETGAGERKAS